jgi:hypothetical protein
MRVMASCFLCLTSKMSHAGSWRASCVSTRRDRSRRWLWRLVRLLVFFGNFQSMYRRITLRPFS